jgi:hypothetical protein
MTSRRLRVLIQHLPAESATMTALRNELSDAELAAQADHGEPERASWSQQELLLASLVDAVRRVEHVLICSNLDSKARRPEPPEPLRRPGAKPPEVRRKLTDDGAEILFQLINGGAA